MTETHTSGSPTLPPLPAPALRNRLSTRILAASIGALVVALFMIFGTLWLSWQLEGAAAAINDTGSLRMRASRIGLHLVQPEEMNRHLVREEIALMEETLAGLHHGNPIRPLFLPLDADVQAQMHTVTVLWETELKPAALSGLEGQDGQVAVYLGALPAFIEQANHLVKLIESDNSGKTSLLRMSQGVLIVIACAGTLAMVYLLYLWIIVPVLQLQNGLQRMAARDFSTRLPVESNDEFGVLAQGFNRMAAELQGLYADLEARVQKKTEQFAAQNRELTALYDIAAFLNQPGDIDSMCRGFLERVMKQFGAGGGSIRVIDPSGEQMHMVVSAGLSSELAEQEHCMKVDACFCGAATRQGVVVIRDFSKVSAPEAQPLNCVRDGFRGLAVFRIMTQQDVLGSFSLQFATPQDLPASEIQLLETLGQRLGVALENLRLSAQARQLAVAAERNLVAQGLHDSIAQGLNYLNLQVQMLADAARRADTDEVNEIVPRLQTGISESYQDVRELLANFRSKLEAGELKSAVINTVSRFERQTGMPVALDMQGGGAPLPPEQQLQVLFILQEALSNVRKHAQASQVNVRIVNGRDFELDISDDGIGFDPDAAANHGEGKQIGLGIMHERATRLKARLSIQSVPSQGTRVSLVLPQQERQAA
ncbi:MAG TPA: type IV pili methyl-accepting chemotaxis transducer N-terminal domain-containing protein [Rhodocyclaceae bacterium]|nr:type IV pili methyl-accepting chemotaxis transducer N-terminal domain-containing protein [Rhodocyclaceae bacterium]